MADAYEFPFRGWVIWLTPGQGGRQAGPPIPRTTWPYYAASAYVPPQTADTGLASFVLRNFEAARGDHPLRDAGWRQMSRANNWSSRVR